MAKVAKRLSALEMESIFPPEGGDEEGSVAEQAGHEEAREIAQGQGQGWVGGVTGADTPPWIAPEDNDPEDESFVYRNSPRVTRMEGKVFNPSKHMRQLRGRGGETDYLDAKWRIVWARSEFPDLVIVTEVVRLATEGAAKDRIAIFKATVRLPGDQGTATGFGSETEPDFKDYIEKAETKAISRALQHLGYGTAFAQDDGELVTDAPVEQRKAAPPKGVPATPARDEATTANHKDGLGFPPVVYEGRRITNMTQMQRAIYAAPGHEERQDLYDLAKAAGWGKPALTVIREDWDGANRADEIATVAE